jgi:hypothetical protein
MVLLFMLHGLHLRVVGGAKDAMIYPYDSESIAYMFWLMRLSSRPVVIRPTRASPGWVEHMLACCLRPDAPSRAIAAAVLSVLSPLEEAILK